MTMEQYIHMRNVPMYTIASSCKIVLCTIFTFLCICAYVSLLSLAHSKLHQVDLDGKSQQSMPWQSDVPWVYKRNTLPNFFMRKLSSNGRKWPPNNYYRNGTIVFVHNTKAGGTAMRQCIKELRKPWNKTVPTGLYSAVPKQLRQFYKDMFNSSDIVYRNDMYWGDLAIGVCEYTDKPCSYFTLLREPYERVVASYNMCRSRKQKPHICKLRQADQMTLKEWATFLESLTFDQLLLNPEFFGNNPQYTDLSKQVLVDAGEGTHNFAWMENRLILKNLINETQKHDILIYVIDNLKHWFSVIGITESYDKSFQLFEHVYQLPFYSQCKSPKEILMHDAVESRRLVEELKSDPDVTRALYFDVEIYKAAKQIFLSQVQLFNRERSFIG